jgi:ketosteroid isomerase-like protein
MTMPRWLALAVLVVVVAGAGEASAQAKPDPAVTAAFTAFVDGVAAGKPVPANVELFLPPGNDDGEPRPSDLAPTRKLLDKPKVKVLAAVVAPAGTSAWVAAEITAKVPRSGKIKKESLRASALLVKEGGAWSVRATHWSGGVKNVVDAGCGALDFEWMFEGDVPAKVEAPVKAVLAAFEDPDARSLVALLSDDKRAYVIGSAPGEKIVGGPKIKSVFKKWNVNLLYWDKDAGKLPSRAGLSPDGELMWMTAATMVSKLCTSYRSFFVLAKEPGGWRIVHQHYSEPLYLD